MSNEFVTVRNILNGGVAKVRPHIANHEVFGKNLEIVPDGTKPFKSLEELYPKPLALIEDEVEDEEYDLEEEED
jgi:hypothetical protein